MTIPHKRNWLSQVMGQLFLFILNSCFPLMAKFFFPHIQELDFGVKPGF